MDTPICDFAAQYAQKGDLRLHMPGHKGAGFLGVEHLDITEIEGADSLYEASGIIAKSEENASALFGCKTFYSTEGSSQCIRAMLYLAVLHAKAQGKAPLIAVGRNAHKTFLSAAALLDLQVLWLYPEETESYLSCSITPQQLDSFLSSLEIKPTAVYLTSPDYLGNVADIQSAAQVCRRHNCLLLVDNAHGAYLRFLPVSRHPMDLGADICCDSAHKTLPVLTGGAYLHLSDKLPAALAEQGKNALALFGSTSPSYLILQSLDGANPYLANAYPSLLEDFLPMVEELREKLRHHGFILMEQEPLKLTVSAKPFGYTGTQLADLLQKQKIICEFADPDYLVLMLTPQIGEKGIHLLENVLLSIKSKAPLQDKPPIFHRCEQVMRIREAALSPAEQIPVSESLGRILAAASVGCPPAVPILICGERIDQNAIDSFAYYGIEDCFVVAE